MMMSCRVMLHDNYSSHWSTQTLRVGYLQSLHVHATLIVLFSPGCPCPFSLPSTSAVSSVL